MIKTLNRSASLALSDELVLGGVLVAHDPDTGEAFTSAMLVDHANALEEQVDHLVDVEIASRDKTIAELEAQGLRGHRTIVELRADIERLSAPDPIPSPEDRRVAVYRELLALQADGCALYDAGLVDAFDTIHVAAYKLAPIVAPILARGTAA